MTVTLPEGAPETLGAAFAHIGGVTAPTITDMKVMVLVEAAGLALYEATAQATDNADVQALLRHNGREELAHANRVSKAIKAITGEDFLPPEPADNPYLAGPIPSTPVTPEGLRKTSEAEFGGEHLYELWASNINNDEAARLFRLNGKEETDHGNRLLEAARLLEA
jgi:rubrerythrin